MACSNWATSGDTTHISRYASCAGFEINAFSATGGSMSVVLGSLLTTMECMLSCLPEVRSKRPSRLICNVSVNRTYSPTTADRSAGSGSCLQVGGRWVGCEVREVERGPTAAHVVVEENVHLLAEVLRSGTKHVHHLTNGGLSLELAMISTAAIWSLRPSARSVQAKRVPFASVFALCMFVAAEPGMSRAPGSSAARTASAGRRRRAANPRGRGTRPAPRHWRRPPRCRASGPAAPTLRASAAACRPLASVAALDRLNSNIPVEMDVNEHGSTALNTQWTH